MNSLPGQIITFMLITLGVHKQEISILSSVQVLALKNQNQNQNQKNVAMKREMKIKIALLTVTTELA